MQRLLLFVVVLLSFLVRTTNLSDYPVGFTPDEASWGYDAYSLLTTGKDQWGEEWPLTLRSFGDFKLPLYAYLTIPSVAMFGLNEFAVRLPNAVLGTLAVLTTYLMVSELFKNKTLALTSAIFLSMSPWHLSLSRGAFEANLTTFFMPLGVWAFLKGAKSPRWMFVAALAFGLNLFTYHSARIVTPLIIFLLLFFVKKEFEPKRHKVSVVVFSILLLLAAYTMFSGSAQRGADIAIFNPTDKWSAVADRRYEAVLKGLPDLASRLFSNKVVYISEVFLTNYLSYLSPQFLFTQGAGEWTYGMIPGRGVLYLVELPFVLTSIWSLTRKKSKALLFIIGWILLAPIPAALTKGPGYAANRATGMMPAIQILSAYGAAYLWNIARSLKQGKVIVATGLAGLIISTTFFFEDYIFHSPNQAAGSMLYGRNEAINFAKSIEDQYSQIIVSRSLSEPQIYVAFYKQWDPSDYQMASKDWLRYEAENRSFVDQLGEYSLGKYVFKDLNYNKENSQNILYIGKPNEFPSETKTLKTINYPDRKPALLIVDNKTSQSQK